VLRIHFILTRIWYTGYTGSGPWIHWIRTLDTLDPDPGCEHFFKDFLNFWGKKYDLHFFFFFAYIYDEPSRDEENFNNLSFLKFRFGFGSKMFFLIVFDWDFADFIQNRVSGNFVKQKSWGSKKGIRLKLTPIPQVGSTLTPALQANAIWNHYLNLSFLIWIGPLT